MSSRLRRISTVDASYVGSMLGETLRGQPLERVNVALAGGEPIVVGLMAATISFGGKVANAYGSTGSGDGFIAKLSPSGAGLWAYGIGGSDNNDQVNAVAVDAQGNTACTGKLGGEGSPITLFGRARSAPACLRPLSLR